MGVHLGVWVHLEVGVHLGTGVGVDLGAGVGVDLGTGVGVDLGTGVGVDLGAGVGVDLGAGVGVGWCMVQDFRYPMIVAVVAVIVAHFLQDVPNFFQLKGVCFHALDQSTPLIPSGLFVFLNKC